MADNREAGPPSTSKRASVVRPLIFLLLLGGIVFTVRYFHLQEYLEKERLRQFIAAYGVWGPLIYLTVWTLAPPLSFPGLPLTLTGGLLFGPFWGTIYTVVGATMGAALAFLMARYLARDYVEARLAGTRLMVLDEKVAQQGWKVVAFIRLIPIFPYFLVNFAFGLTRISLGTYTIATFIFMLPLTFAFVYFSSNILDLFQGKVSKELLLGVVLVALVSLIPVVFKKIKSRRGQPLDFPDE